MLMLKSFSPDIYIMFDADVVNTESIRSDCFPVNERARHKVWSDWDTLKGAEKVYAYLTPATEIVEIGTDLHKDRQFLEEAAEGRFVRIMFLHNLFAIEDSELSKEDDAVWTKLQVLITPSRLANHILSQMDPETIKSITRSKVKGELTDKRFYLQAIELHLDDWSNDEAREDAIKQYADWGNQCL